MRACEVFEILGEAAAAAKPPESPLDDPALGQKFKPGGRIGAFDDFERDASFVAHR